MKLVDLPTRKQAKPAELASDAAKLISDLKPDRFACVCRKDGEYHLISCNSTWPELLWLFERGREMVLDSEGEPGPSKAIA